MPNTRIFQVDNYEDLVYLFENYGMFYSREFKKLKIDYSKQLLGLVELNFEMIAVDWDIIWLTKQGMRETHLTMPFNLYGWDCESSVWLRDKFEVIA